MEPFCFTSVAAPDFLRTPFLHSTTRPVAGHVPSVRHDILFRNTAWGSHGKPWGQRPKDSHGKQDVKNQVMQTAVEVGP